MVYILQPCHPLVRVRNLYTKQRKNEREKFWLNCSVTAIALLPYDPIAWEKQRGKGMRLGKKKIKKISAHAGYFSADRRCGWKRWWWKEFVAFCFFSFYFSFIFLFFFCLLFFYVFLVYCFLLEHRLLYREARTNLLEMRDIFFTLAISLTQARSSLDCSKEASAKLESLIFKY